MAAIPLNRLYRKLSSADKQRVKHNVWIRYRLDLRDRTYLAPPSVTLTPLAQAHIEQLRTHPNSTRDQVASGLRFWKHGLREGFIWLDEDNEPLCFIWLFQAKHNALLRTLPDWSGMYPPLPTGWARFENVFTFGRGLRRPGGAATDFAYAVLARLQQQSLKGLLTHVHIDNLMARRWVERIGFQPIGTTVRSQLDVPYLRHRPWFFHGSHTAPPPLATTVRRVNASVE
ncbi:hypothetical protein CAI21_19855 [Alkalilimnicola ehrlichii]|uniref:N-acetyltransferase domain-containing protein n=1 Tax=Alkalilimnicola ehrlichii TaxID=351052 RepID=A0A3E0WJP8_9GAMM|nr:hypothetical protein [Alkalilimnicola ehrlichii]RFA25151.1 hypothetical protein CAI21_19855 [Alkalilimnicola ehrlichii]RFA32105.1 hypothetical protein CAL65_20435 [Alkalilimnicola ehrlichii]